MKTTKSNPKNSALEINPKLKLFKTPNNLFVIITGNKKNHTVESNFKETAEEAWESAYRKLANK